MSIGSRRAICDASAAFELLLAGDAGRRVAATLDDKQVHVPALFALEVCAAARARLLSGDVTVGRAEQVVTDVLRFPAVVWGHEPALLLRAWALRDNITTYDAVYVALAEQLGAVLITADRRLASAVRIFAACDVVDTTLES
ncbi:MAG: type II toxin-antitoxin system VapC family toxin [Actinomycetota bacterium]|nr:type II toxin-antitoxin system VapC family toxin [Actinomycetota bacterium]